MSSELVERLKHAHQHSQQRVLGSHIFGEAAARIEALEAENARLRKALEPFASIGQWMFARDLPDATPVVRVEGLGKPFNLTRGMFKAAQIARRAREGDDNV